MTRRILYWLLAVLVVVSVAACGKTEPTPVVVQQAATATTAPTATPVPTQAPVEKVVAKVYKIGTNAEYPPFESVDAAGKIVGFDPDLIAAIADNAGFQFEFINTRWDGIFVALQSGEFDAVISAATITDERSQIVDFSDPYFNAGQMIAIPIGSDIQSVADLNGKKVGVQLGTTGDMWLTDNTQAEVIRYDEITMAFQAMANNDLDAVFNDAPVSAEIIRANPEMNATLVGDPVTDEFYGIAVNKDQKDLLQAINKGLAAVKADGTYDAIYDTYFGVPEGPTVEGMALVEDRCTKCHNLDRVKAAKKDAAGWKTTVTRMRGNGAQVTDAEAEAIIAYLAATYK